MKEDLVVWWTFPRETAEGAQEELVKVKEMYSQACQDLAQLEEKLHGEYNSRLKNDVAEVLKTWSYTGQIGWLMIRFCIIEINMPYIFHLFCMFTVLC